MVKEQFRIYSKLNVFKKRLDKSKMIINKWLSMCKNPYIAFSAGKDSTCVLNLVREQNKNVIAVYFDADCAFPEASELIAKTENVIKFKTTESFLDILKRTEHLSDNEIDKETMRITVHAPIKKLITEFKFDACAYGLRAEESKARKMNFKTKGNIFKNKKGTIMCQPIAHWTYYDVWGYIFSENIDYCGTYDRMWNMPEREQRISYWAGESNRNFGRWAWLKKNYPELFNKLNSQVYYASSYI